MAKLDEIKIRAARNRTINLTKEDISKFKKKLLVLKNSVRQDHLINTTVNQDILTTLPHLPENFVDLLVIDPPYNLNKQFNSHAFKEMSAQDYEEWLNSWLDPLRKILKQTASIYICGDWKSSSAIFRVMSRYFKVRNRITWEREKGRGAKTNWKNCSEDIWFGTVSNEFTFHSDAVMLKRKVIAPYKDDEGNPKDWSSEKNGNYRLTHPSNLWTDLTIPFWSMPENTDHPTQKPEKLIAKIILASSNRGDFVFDPFVGSGTTSVVAKKLGRKFCGVEIDELYSYVTEKRLEMANYDTSIQGYVDNVFWERNSLSEQGNAATKRALPIQSESLFTYLLA